MQVIFLGDINRGDQAGNINNIYDLFSPIFKSEKIRTSTFITEINQNADREYWIPKWHQALVEEDISLIRHLNLEETLIVGFEIPEFLLYFFDNADVRWVNLSIHPVRFSDDLYFNVESSFEYDHSHNGVDESFLYLQAQLIKRAHAARNELNRISDPKTLLILGQEPFDKSVYFDNTFKSLLDYKEQIQSLIKDYDRVIYKPHLFATNNVVDDEIITLFNASVANDNNFYALLSKNTIHTCTAISSTTLNQAQYFDSEAIFLEERAKKFSIPIDFYSLFSDKVFWIEKALSMRSSQKSDHHRLSLPKNLLRNIFSHWGYFPLSPDSLHLNHFIYLNRNQIIASQNDILTLRDELNHFKNILNQQQIPFPDM